jgi:exodeoxyribonuclease III
MTTIATFNVNSVRSRLSGLLSWLEAVCPDVLCLQETKVQDPDFPMTSFQEVGYHAVYRGQKAYNGVAILSRRRPASVVSGFDDGGPADDARLLIAAFDGLTVINAYVPQGRDVEHAMYRYKLAWLARLRDLFERRFSPRDPLVWVGDLNVAPTPIDVHDPKRLLGHVCFNPEVTAALQSVIDWGWIDVFRKHVPDPGQFTYYDYRARNAVQNGKGWRIDHILATQPVADRSDDAWIDLTPRTGEKPSDHTPLLARFDL